MVMSVTVMKEKKYLICITYENGKKEYERESGWILPNYTSDKKYAKRFTLEEAKLRVQRGYGVNSMYPVVSIKGWRDD